MVGEAKVEEESKAKSEDEGKRTEARAESPEEVITKIPVEDEEEEKHMAVDEQTPVSGSRSEEAKEEEPEEPEEIGDEDASTHIIPVSPESNFKAEPRTSFPEEGHTKTVKRSSTLNQVPKSLAMHQFGENKLEAGINDNEAEIERIAFWSQKKAGFVLTKSWQDDRIAILHIHKRIVLTIFKRIIDQLKRSQTENFKTVK